MRNKPGGLTAAIFSIVLAACGGGDATFIGDPQLPPTEGGDPTLTGVRVGTLSGGSFTPGQLWVGEGETGLSAGGQTAVRLDVVDAAGQRLLNVPLTATFQSECSAGGLSRFEPATVESDSGRFDVTYIAQGCRDNDELVASVSVNGQNLTASAVVDVASPELGRVEFVFAESTVIGLIGSPKPTQAEVQFRVRDQTGGVVPNQAVDFALSSAVGGLRLMPAQATTDSQGIVRTVVSGGSIPTAVRVTATVTLPSGMQISTQSEQLAVSTGIPDQDSMSLSADRLAVDGTCDGEPATISIRIADRFNNPVPEGTAVNFRTSHGAINPTCFTGDPLGDPLTESGVCSVLLRVSNPRPDNGAVALLASALGEESFVDENGNGFFDPGVDSFPAENDLPEPFLDRNENGVRDGGEEFIDTDESQSYSVADGRFNGYVCDAPGENCRTEQVHVRANATIVFSAARAGVLVGCPGSPSGGCPLTPILLPGQSLNLVLTVEDVNGQVPPTGTTYTLAATTGTIIEPATVGPFNTSAPGPQVVAFRYQAPTELSTTPASQLLTLTIDLPASACSGPASISAVVGEFVF